MSATLKQLLTLDQLDLNLFRSQYHMENFRKTLFGGQVLAQALKAAFLTVNNRLPHSLHAYFLHAGSSDSPVIYDIEELKNGRSISNRQINARQHGKIIFTMTVSFHEKATGYHHQSDMPLDVMSPQALIEAGLMPQNQHIPDNDNKSKSQAGPFELLPVSLDNFTSKNVMRPQCQFWMRTSEALGTTLIDQYCALAFASDYGLLATTLMPHPATLFDKNIAAASIDHALWFHSEAIDMNDWMLCDVNSPWAGDSRGFAKASIFSPKGILLASSTQEGLLRKLD